MHVFSVIVEDNDPPFEVMLVELVPGQLLDDLFETVYKNVDPTVRQRAAIIVVRPAVKWPLDPDKIERVLSGELSEYLPRYEFLNKASADPLATFGRVTAKPVYILASTDYRHFLSRNINPGATHSPIDVELPADAAIDAIKRYELDLMVANGRALLPGAPGVLYRAPSKRLMRSFLRVGNIQRSRAALDAVFFWLLPYLRDCVGIITDTWSISSISMNASRRLAVYCSGQDILPPCPVEMLSQYHDGSPTRTTEAVEIIEQLLARVSVPGAPARVVFLLSATHTGSLAASLDTLLNQRGHPADVVQFVALFKVGSVSPPMPALRDLSTGGLGQDFSPISATDIEDAVETIEIDDQVYFPLQYRDITFEVRNSHASAMCEFLKRYADADLIRVHRTVRDDSAPRHHGIWIDTLALVKHPTFQKRFIDQIRTLDPVPDLIIAPKHPAAEELAKIALAIIHESKPDAQFIAHSNLLVSNPPKPGDETAAEAVDALPADGALLILDDAFITGGRLQGYQTHLRNRKFLGRRHYLVAIARPPALRDWEHRQRMAASRRSADGKFVTPKHTVNAVEEIVLPDWREAECPWCAEMELYRRHEAITGSALPHSTLRDRLAMLTNASSTGLSNDIFLDTPLLPPLQITNESHFVPKSVGQAAVFASVAGALQRLRAQTKNSDRPALGPRRFPISTVLNYEEYLIHTYTDSVIRASFFRASRRDELVYADRELEAKRTSRAKDLIFSETQTESNLAAEIALAAAAGKIPELSLGAEDFAQAPDDFHEYLLAISDLRGESQPKTRNPSGTGNRQGGSESDPHD